MSGVMSGGGISVDVPPGWDGEIFSRAAGPTARLSPPGAGPVSQNADGGESGFGWPVAHVASFRLPADRGDFASSVVETMPGDGVLVCVLDYGPGEGAGIFSQPGPPVAVSVGDFAADQLQRTVPGRLGLQRFFHRAGHHWCLYVVVGGARHLVTATTEVNRVLARLRLG